MGQPENIQDQALRYVFGQLIDPDTRIRAAAADCLSDLVTRIKCDSSLVSHSLDSFILASFERFTFCDNSGSKYDDALLSTFRRMVIANLSFVVSKLAALNVRLGGEVGEGGLGEGEEEGGEGGRRGTERREGRGGREGEGGWRGEWRGLRGCWWGCVRCVREIGWTRGL